jgi:hypothetical protein
MFDAKIRSSRIQKSTKGSNPWSRTKQLIEHEIVLTLAMLVERRDFIT